MRKWRWFFPKPMSGEDFRAFAREIERRIDSGESFDSLGRTEWVRFMKRLRLYYDYRRYLYGYTTYDIQKWMFWVEESNNLSLDPAKKKLLDEIVKEICKF